jgi:hypothetical protein
VDIAPARVVLKYAYQREGSFRSAWNERAAGRFTRAHRTVTAVVGTHRVSRNLSIAWPVRALWKCGAGADAFCAIVSIAPLRVVLLCQWTRLSCRSKQTQAMQLRFCCEKMMIDRGIDM